MVMPLKHRGMCVVMPVKYRGILMLIFGIYTLYLHSVAQSVERWSRDPGTRVQFPAGGLGAAFFATGPGWVLKCISPQHSNSLHPTLTFIC